MDVERERPTVRSALPILLNPMLRKSLNILIIVLAVAIVLPIPLAYAVGFTYHWLLLITIPIGVPLLLGAIVWRVLLGSAPKVAPVN